MQNVLKDIKKMAACGGCTAKLPPGMLKDSLKNLPVFQDPNLLVGFESNDDGAVYKLSEDIAVVQTVDFFPPMVEDPYIFGQIAAANAISDIYAMGGEVKFALNIVAFPENEDPGILAAMLQGGAEKVKEAGAVLSGGHSISDDTIKYGMAVTGVVNPSRIMKNNRCRIGDVLILTKPLGVGLVTASYNAGQASEESMEAAIHSMTTLNKYAWEIASTYNVSSVTDVTGFGFLGHLNEMVPAEVDKSESKHRADKKYTMQISSGNIGYIPEAARLAQDFLLTAAGQHNRRFLKNAVEFNQVDGYMQEILFDPQTSGGLLIAVEKSQAKNLLAQLGMLNTTPSIVGEVVPYMGKNISVW